MMLRLLYVWLVRLHPRRFRERFGAEMLSIYDDAAGTRSAALFLADAAASLVRQWTLRPESRRPAAEGPRMLCILESDMPGRGALVNGVLCALAAFCLVSFAIARGGGAPLRSYAGIFGLGGTGFGRPDAPGAREAPAAGKVPSLGAVLIRTLDRNHDGVITAPEIDDAPHVLRTFQPGSTTDVPIEFVIVRRLPAGHASAHGVPVRMLLIEALDADGDGVISAAEIRNAAAALRSLDRNGDGSLTAEEILGI